MQRSTDNHNTETAPNLVTSPPFYCWHGHFNEVCALQKELFIMAPVHSLASPQALLATERPVFFVAMNGRKLPPDFMEVLAHRPGARVVRITDVGEKA